MALPSRLRVVLEGRPRVQGEVVVQKLHVSRLEHYREMELGLRCEVIDEIERLALFGRQSLDVRIGVGLEVGRANVRAGVSSPEEKKINPKKGLCV
jgi:hypothetical protein